ncbi:MAG: type II toxin-antitoxin system HicB family antitoxin [Saprospiraceae bacterium]
METISRTFRVVITKTEDGYMANIPSLNHCMSFGESPDEAIHNLNEALEGVLETMKENDWPIPDDRNSLETMIMINHSYKSI